MSSLLEESVSDAELFGKFDDYRRQIEEIDRERVVLTSRIAETRRECEHACAQKTAPLRAKLKALDEARRQVEVTMSDTASALRKMRLEQCVGRRVVVSRHRREHLAGTLEEIWRSACCAVALDRDACIRDMAPYPHDEETLTSFGAHFDDLHPDGIWVGEIACVYPEEAEYQFDVEIPADPTRLEPSDDCPL